MAKIKLGALRRPTSLDFATAQLRHAYRQLVEERVVRQREFAEGLLGPAIRFLEELKRDGGHDGPQENIW